MTLLRCGRFRDRAQKNSFRDRIRSWCRGVKTKGDKLLLAVIVAASVALMVFIRHHGRRDPTDNETWYLGMFTLAFAAGLLSPGRPWRWGVATVVPHYVLIFYPEVSNLWPLAMIFMSVLAIPTTLLAWSGSSLRRSIVRWFGVKPVEPPVLDGADRG